MTIIQSIFKNKNRTSNKTIIKKLKLLYPFEFKIIKIVGTNGKGSVSNYLTTNLMKKYRVGTFTSPHIIKANERIKVNNKEIPNDILERLIIKYNKIHFFGIMFLCALEYFKKLNCDIVILEAGIGGKLDTTNTIDGEIGILTSIGIDHTEFLGNTKIEILKNKIGILNNNMNFYTGTEISEYDDIIDSACLENNSKHFKIENSFETYKKRNQALATMVLENEFNINGEYQELLGRATIQKINDSIAILDVAHNMDGIKATLEYLKEKSYKFEQVVVSMSRKKIYKNLTSLFEGKDIFVYQLNSDFINHNDIKANEVKDLKKFYDKQKRNTLYIGSFYTIGEILNVHKKT